MRLAGESGLPERTIKELAGAVAGKRAPGAIGPVSTRCETHKEDTPERISEARHRPAPVLLSAVRAPLHAAGLFTMRHQARTA